LELSYSNKIWGGIYQQTLVASAWSRSLKFELRSKNVNVINSQNSLAWNNLLVGPIIDEIKLLNTWRTPTVCHTLGYTPVVYVGIIHILAKVHYQRQY